MFTTPTKAKKYPSCQLQS